MTVPEDQNFAQEKVVNSKGLIRCGNSLGLFSSHTSENVRDPFIPGSRKSEASMSATFAKCSREITTRSLALLCPQKPLEQDSSKHNQVPKIKNK
ncbi:hypothetical protein LEMLEM_LOCUS12621 [Lemmus lemmus]